MHCWIGERSRPGCCSVRLAPNTRGVNGSKRWHNFVRSCEPRGRGSLRPRRARPRFFS